MDASNDAKLLELRTLVRSRFGRDLRSLTTISEERPELSLADLLEEIHNVYTHYLRQDTLLSNASSCVHQDNSRLQEELNRLRSIDGN